MTARTRIEAALIDRRMTLCLTWRDIVTASGVSHETLRQLRIGEPVSDLTKAAVERALGWARGSIDTVAEGGEPTLAPVPDPWKVTVNAADVMTVLGGPIVNASQFMEAAKRLHLACLVEAEIVEEEDQ
ncbi:hypothetical protein NGM33_28415 [Nocardiopsis dassonvillei]|uniref:hypothetical protein n=1 Tax=Nocardiopsis dassonvillei TaxID=2014 RepID=UPI0020A43F9B|nr:hypothetical protein [Nocardiopsis dassonvillei]MCP3017260.1 hypothetical protein [Nocardiopsis dassonvillei]